MDGSRYARNDLSTGQKLVESWKGRSALALAARTQRAGRGAQGFQGATVGRLQLSGADCGATPDAVSRRRSHLWPDRGKLSQGTERSSTGDVRRWHQSLDGTEATVDGDTERMGGGVVRWWREGCR